MALTSHQRKIGSTSPAYAQLRERVREVFLLGQRRIEEEKVKTYWQTGKLIQLHLLANKDRAEYGAQVLPKLAEDLEVSYQVLRRMVQFYQLFPILSTSRELSWAHYCELLPIKEDAVRREFAKRAEQQEWTAHELRRKVQDEISTETASNRSIDAPLKAKLGALYTYRIVQPEQIHDERPYVLIDLGFATYRRLYKTDFKPGDLVETVWNEAKGDYKIVKSKADASALFTYNAFIERVVDGDTVHVKVDLGFDTWTRQYLRLRGLDCPEMNTEDGRKAKRFLEKELAGVPFIQLTSTRSDKYDRYLADIWAGEKYLNQALLDKNFAFRV